MEEVMDVVNDAVLVEPESDEVVHDDVCCALVMDKQDMDIWDEAVCDSVNNVDEVYYEVEYLMVDTKELLVVHNAEALKVVQ